MTIVDETQHESHAFEADVAKLLHMMVHSVYSDKDVFLRELISNAADAWERLRYEASPILSYSEMIRNPASPSPSMPNNDASRLRTTASA